MKVSKKITTEYLIYIPAPASPVAIAGAIAELSQRVDFGDAELSVKSPDIYLIVEGQSVPKEVVITTVKTTHYDDSTLDSING